MMRATSLALVGAVVAASSLAHAQTNSAFEAGLDRLDFRYHERAQAIQTLSVDRVIAYLQDDEAPSGTDTVSLIFDPRKNQGLANPATAYFFNRAESGEWEGRKVAGVLPYGWAGNYGATSFQSEVPSFLCVDEAVSITNDDADTLNRIVDADWAAAPLFLGRGNSHGTEVGIRVRLPGREYARHFSFLRRSDDVFSKNLSQADLEAFKSEFELFEGPVVNLSDQFGPVRRDECASTTAVRALPRDSLLEAGFEIETNRIQAELDDLRNSKE